MTFLSEVSAVANQIGVEAPQTLIGNQTPAAKRMVSIANLAGKRLARAHDWSVLQGEFTFPLVVDQVEYDLPADFDHFISGTSWDRTDSTPLQAGLTPVGWQWRVSRNIATTSAGLRFTAANGSGVLRVNPAPGEVHTLAIEYISRNWCQDTGGTSQSQFMADSDTLVVDEYLWRLGFAWMLLQSLNQPYADQLAEYDEALDQLRPMDNAPQTLVITTPSIGPWDNPMWRARNVNAPSGGFGL